MARCLALLGMVATHVLDSHQPDGDLSFAQAVAGGRASSLFAVLAGVTLALMTGGREPVRGRERAARSLGIAVRALVIALIGFVLGDLQTGLAIILTYYGLLFLLGLPFVGLRAPALFALAGLWLVVAPVVSQLVRPELPPRGFNSPSLVQLAEPGRLLSELAFTGYYPVVPWLAYLLAGMALGRLDLSRRRVQVWVAGAGFALAVLATFVSRLATSRPEVLDALVAGGGTVAATGPALLDEIAGGMFGQTPVGGPWEWLLVVAPHSTTPFDLAQTIGSALAVIGCCLLLVGVLPKAWTRGVAIAFGAGTMTLSLYTLHVLMKTPEVPPAETPASFGWHVAVLVLVGALSVHAGIRGPLERMVTHLSGRAAARVRRRDRVREPGQPGQPDQPRQPL